MCLEIFIMFFLVVPGESTRNCGGKCCEGYNWDVNREKCEKCKPGNIGSNCSEKCPYPTYGDGCQQICYCSAEACDFVTGCNPMSSVKFGSVSYQAPSSSPNKTDYATREISTSSVSDSGDLNITFVILIKILG
ncbi:uncharacterized protein LOC111100313 [Crassostrea virginica]|uniref:Multiple epidermal growth factor-like domains protein 10 n=1 Tax=Crassostrea virginica TaxID=6565 RepID=A0A8B8A8I5_CRAVI|nr:multiple epidermal growth factor-like domains protein 10 [Crassostrea virginica]